MQYPDNPGFYKHLKLHIKPHVDFTLQFFRILCAKNYEEWIKLLQVIEENLVGIFEAHGRE